MIIRLAPTCTPSLSRISKIPTFEGFWGEDFELPKQAEPPTETLNGKHTIFGRVIGGMEVATQLTVRDPGQDPSKLPEADRIKSVTIVEK